MHSYWQASCADLLRAGPFPRQGLLGCVPWPEHYPTVFALGFLMVSKVRQAASDPFCLTSSIHGAPSLDAWAEINPFSLELLFSEYLIIATEKETLQQRVNHRVAWSIGT